MNTSWPIIIENTYTSHWTSFLSQWGFCWKKYSFLTKGQATLYRQWQNLLSMTTNSMATKASAFTPPSFSPGSACPLMMLHVWFVDADDGSNPCGNQWSCSRHQRLNIQQHNLTFLKKKTSESFKLFLVSYHKGPHCVSVNSPDEGAILHAEPHWACLWQRKLH